MRDPDVGSCARHLTNRVTPDGPPTPHWFSKRRRFAARTLEESWTSAFPFHPNTVVFDRGALVGVGRWPDLRVNEDLALVLAISTLYPDRANP